MNCNQRICSCRGQLAAPSTEPVNACGVDQSWLATALAVTVMVVIWAVGMVAIWRVEDLAR